MLLCCRGFGRAVGLVLERRLLLEELAEFGVELLQRVGGLVAAEYRWPPPHRMRCLRAA